MALREIKTDRKTPKAALTDIYRKLINDPMVKELGDENSISLVERNGKLVLIADVAFDAIMGFVYGMGLYGYEGFGPAGPILGGCPHVIFEPYDSYSLKAYEK